MIHVRISEVKNRLSHYLRLVRGGEEVEILDRDTPVARIVNVANSSDADSVASWQAELVQEGIITPARKKGEFPREFFNKKNKPEAKGILQALLEERTEGWR
jgi:prevent-host-death family protein